jgi:hypothetical protein
LGGNIRVLALSYDSCLVQTENNGHIEDVSELGRNILHTLVFRFFSRSLNPCRVQVYNQQIHLFTFLQRWLSAIFFLN